MAERFAVSGQGDRRADDIGRGRRVPVGEHVPLCRAAVDLVQSADGLPPTGVVLVVEREEDQRISDLRLGGPSGAVVGQLRHQVHQPYPPLRGGLGLEPFPRLCDGDFVVPQRGQQRIEHDAFIGVVVDEGGGVQQRGHGPVGVDVTQGPGRRGDARTVGQRGGEHRRRPLVTELTQGLDDPLFEVVGIPVVRVLHRPLGEAVARDRAVALDVDARSVLVAEPVALLVPGGPCGLDGVDTLAMSRSGGQETIEPLDERRDCLWPHGSQLGYGQVARTWTVHVSVVARLPDTQVLNQLFELPAHPRHDPSVWPSGTARSSARARTPGTLLRDAGSGPEKERTPPTPRRFRCSKVY